jgi:hypothetical protein
VVTGRRRPTPRTRTSWSRPKENRRDPATATRCDPQPTEQTGACAGRRDPLLRRAESPNRPSNPGL